MGSTQNVVNIGELAVVGEAFLGPGLDHHVDGLVESVTAGVDVNTDAVELLLLVAGADAEVEAAVADDVEHGHFFGDQDWVMQRQDNDRGSDPDVLRAPGDGAEE